MQTLARTIVAGIAVVALAACGSDDQPDAEASGGEPAKTESDKQADAADETPVASVTDFCKTYKGEDVDFSKVKTVGELVSLFEDQVAALERVGVPDNMTDAQREALDGEVAATDELLGAVRSLDQSMPVEELQEQTELEEVFKEFDTKVDSPEMDDYVGKSC